jgi:metallo-beta-lactamase family protein
MKIRFCGAARTVTGSQHLLTINGKNILLDCGLYQGHRAEAREKNQNFHFSPQELHGVILSHAHIDHCGKLPVLARHGFDGFIFSTTPTVDLCNIMLRDSAHIQEKDSEWLRKKRDEEVEPLYKTEDVERVMENFVGMPYVKSFSVAEGAHATFRDAGHILGSASVTLDLRENGRSMRLGFSGDVGRRGMPLLRDPDLPDDLDALILESTYGNREHGDTEEIDDDLAEVVNAVYQRGGKIIIPAFSVGRTQVLIYYLHKLFDQNRIPDIPIYVDSPLAMNATEVFRMHLGCYDRETERTFLDNQEDPFGFEKLIYIRDVEQSKKLNGAPGPMIIISASGMAEAGRVLHHLKNGIEDPKNCVLLVGYMAEHTLGRRLADGETEVKIFGEIYQRRCEVRRVDGLSAHAGRSELLTFVKHNDLRKLKHVFLVHGEVDAAEALAEDIRKLGVANVRVPHEGEEFSV